METQDNGFLKEIDGVRKEKERLTAAKLQRRSHWKEKELAWENRSIRWESQSKLRVFYPSNLTFKNQIKTEKIIWQRLRHLRYSQWKVDRELANHSLSSTASQGTSDIPFPWFLMLGCNSQAQDLRSHGGCRIIGPKVEDKIKKKERRG